jgi:MoxR-like ATPase
MSYYGDRLVLTRSETLTSLNQKVSNLMSIALMVSTPATDGKEQTLLIPTDKEVLVFHRLSTGGRGRGQAWNKVADLSTLPKTELENKPVAVAINSTDVFNANFNNVTALSSRMTNLSGEAIWYGGEKLSHYEWVNNLIAMLIAGDEKLNNYVQDKRRNSPIVLSPIVAEPEVEPELEMAFVPVMATLNEPVTNVIPMPTRSQGHTEMASVPDKSWANRYLNRKNVSKSGKTDFEMLDIIKANNQNLLIRGHAGSGKTMCIVAWASSREYRYYNISSNIGLEPSHLFGMWTPTENAGVFKWQDGPVTDLVRNGGVLLLNEIDFMPERITTVLFGLLDDRREIQLLENGGEVIKAHPDLVVIGDHNPNYRGSRPMNQAWKDRFAHKWDFEYDKAIEKKLIGNAMLIEVANQLREQHERGEIDTPISTRGLEAFVKNTKTVNLDYAIETYLNSFADDEREAVKLVFDTAKTHIASGFGITSNVELQADEVAN